MKISTSSSLLFATLAFSSSSSNLAANAAPAGDVHGAQEVARSFPTSDSQSSIASRGDSSYRLQERDIISPVCKLLGGIVAPLPQPLGSALGDVVGLICPKSTLGAASVEDSEEASAMDADSSAKMQELKSAVAKFAKESPGAHPSASPSDEGGSSDDESMSSPDPDQESSGSVPPPQVSGISPPPNTPSTLFSMPASNPQPTAGGQTSENAAQARRRAIARSTVLVSPPAPKAPQMNAPVNPPSTPQVPKPEVNAKPAVDAKTPVSVPAGDAKFPADDSAQAPMSAPVPAGGVDE